MLNNRIPNTVLWLEAIAVGRRPRAARALPLPAGPGSVPVLVAAVIVATLLYVTFDLDRPTRGLVNVPGHRAHLAQGVDGAAACRELGALETRRVTH